MSGRDELLLGVDFGTESCREAETYEAAAWIVDAPDWARYRLTGRVTANVNTAAVRGYHDRNLAGWPIDFYEEVGIEDAADKLASDVLDLGTVAEGLSRQAAEEPGARVIAPQAAEKVLDHWLASEFDGGGSAAKVEKMKAIDVRYRRERSAGT